MATKTYLALSVTFGLLGAACGSGAAKPATPGRTVDSSCGIDCEAQKAYGLTVGTCFEYTTSPTGTSNPADLGVIVRPVSKLENDVPVVSLEYQQSGQIFMTDHFSLTDGKLLLARREGPFGSYSYQDAAGVVRGVTWLQLTSAADDTYSTDSSVDIITGSDRRTEQSTYRVNAVTPDSAERELVTPFKTYDEGLKLVMSETPNHNVDPQRVFVRDVGFVRFSSRLGTAGQYQTYRLQRIRTPAAGDPPCSLGAP